MEDIVVSHPGSVLSPITFYLHGNRHLFECTLLLLIHRIWLLTMVQRTWCTPPPPGVFTWQHFWGNSASTKGKLLIRHETIASAAGIAISDGTKHWLLLYSHPPLPFHPYQKSPLNHSIHTAHPLSPSNTASSVKHDLPFIAARATEREGTATGGRERWRGREKKKKREREIQEAQAAFHFRCLAMQLCPASTVLANSASSPWEAHLVHNLRPCNAVPGPQW